MTNMAQPAREGAGDEGGAGSAPRPEVVGLVLAAGGGRRLGGRPKALLEHGGRTLAEHAVGTLRAGGVGRVHVVVGAAASAVRALPGLADCVLVENPAWQEGMGTSLRAGLDSLGDTGATAALVLLVDQPGITSEAVARVREAVEGPAVLAAATYDGRRGHPVLLGADHWRPAADSAEGDRGARAYLARHSAALALVPCDGVAAPYDIDVPADLDRLD
ncbi:NTP transferase domain-containing protein [Streptomyces sp. NPDC050560]|uniref:nucleotidyltransferase family protein n=1 Tax=Streptomyces sp. NPDC050560 TaxID=3365630 RepID=UPI0037AAC280